MLSLNETNTNQQQYQHRPTIMSDNPTADPPFVNATTDMKIYELWFRLPLNTNSEKIWTTDFAIPFKENITINLFFCLDDSGTAIGLDNVDPNTIEEGSQHRLFMAQLVIWACAPEESPSSDSSDSESDDDEVLPSKTVINPLLPRLLPSSSTAQHDPFSSSTSRGFFDHPEDSSSFPMEEDPSPPPEAEESSLSPEEEDPSPPPEAEESSSQASTTPSPPPLLAASSTIQVRRLSASIRRGGKMARPVAPPRLPRIRPVSPIADDPSPPPEAEESSSSPEEEDPSPPPEAEESSSQASTTPSPPHLAASSTIQVRRLSASIQRGGRMTRPVAPPRLPQIRPVSPIAGDPSLSPDTEDSSSFPMEEDPSPPPEAEESSSSPMEEDPSPSPEAEDSSPSPEAETSPSNYVPSPPPLSPSPPPAVHPQNTQGTAPRRIMTRSRTLAARQAAVRNSEVFRYISLPTAWDLEEREKQRKAAKFRNEDLSTRLKGNERRGPPPSGAGGSSSIAARYMMLPTTILPDFYGVLGHSSLDTLEMVMSLNASAYNVDQGSATCTTVNKDRGKKRVSDDEDTGENGREQFNGTFFVNKRKRL
ncbi:hypothetical protein EC991_002733 [Linnemannia zychae]|nr:hypothetical protein EC991_002733 [Linnemannia zychae]